MTTFDSKICENKHKTVSYFLTTILALVILCGTFTWQAMAAANDARTITLKYEAQIEGIKAEISALRYLLERIDKKLEK